MNTAEHSHFVRRILEESKCDDIIFLREADWQRSIFALSREMGLKRKHWLAYANGEKSLSYFQYDFESENGEYQLRLFKIENERRAVNYGLAAVIYGADTRIGAYREHV